MKTLRLHTIRMLLFTSILTLNACSPTSQNKNFEQPLTQPTTPDENSLYSKRMIDLTLQEKAIFNESIETMFREISFSSEMDLINCTLNAAYQIGIGNYGTFTTDTEVINECAVTRDHCALLRKEFAGTPRDVQVPKLEIPLDCHVSATDLHTCYRNLLEEINNERKSHYIPCESHTLESIKEAGSIDPDTFTPQETPQICQLIFEQCPSLH